MTKEPLSESDTAAVNIPTQTYKLDDSKTPVDNLGDSDVIQLGLDVEEEDLFETLIATKAAYEKGEINFGADGHPQEDSEELVIRVAGGWVRDKIMGMRTHDVDIATNCLTGVQFATLIQNYLLSLPKSHRHSTEKCPKMGVIAANPAQSKHLETATMKIHTLEVDFCNLRAEEIYEADSRIPTVSIGTPYQDAHRRDFTINALFFNVGTRQVEDWTGRGFRDLRNDKLVTPLEPRTTFLDDPLRVLRAIRFAVRLGFEMDKEMEEACKLDSVHEALQIKVSRERVGKELEKMLTGKDAKPQHALETIGRLNLADSVFTIPNLDENARESKVVQTLREDSTLLGQPYFGKHNDLDPLRKQGWAEALQLLNLYPLLNLPEGSKTSVDHRLLVLALFLSPFRFLAYDEEKRSNNPDVANKKKFLIVSHMVREGIKFKNKDVNAITALMEQVDQWVQFLTNLANNANGKPSVSRLEAGLLLRKSKDLWTTILLLAGAIMTRRCQAASLPDVVEMLYSSIVEEGLDECWKVRPLLDGKVLVKALDLPRGPEIATYLDEQHRWMLINPSGSREDCERHLRSIKRSREEMSNASPPGKQQVKQRKG